MTVSEALSGIKRPGLDTSPVVHFVEWTPAYFPVCSAVFRSIDAGSLQAYAGVITLTETLVKPLRENDTLLADKYRLLLSGSVSGLAPVPITVDTADHAGILRARYNLKTADALQLASALAAGCDAFLTGNRDLRRVAELDVLVLTDLTP